MQPRNFAAFALAAALVPALWSCTAEAGTGNRNVSPGGEFSFRLESDGRTLPTYDHGGYTYVEGIRGARYAIRVFNHTGERVEAVLTVDGRDVVSGRRGNFRTQRGYIIDPYGSVLIDGFRTSLRGVAAFRFTDVPDSYAARMGDATDVGLVGVAVFKERTYRPRPPIVYDRDDRRLGGDLGTGYGRAPAKSAPSGESRAADAPGPCCPEAESQGNIGTGWGEETWSPASEVPFARRGSYPDALLAVQYDDYEGLVARGVLPRPWPAPRPWVSPRPHPFPESPDPRFAAPPPWMPE
ncbi:MAG: hypothetical protein PHU25_15895 [Deltaproteobacteria bacterium]|nr:hypothetical protein [Deltaproteobacteria bacterium]